MARMGTQVSEGKRSEVIEGGSYRCHAIKTGDIGWKRRDHSIPFEGTLCR